MGKKIRLRIMAAIFIISLILSPSGLGGNTIVMAACSGSGTTSSGTPYTWGYGGRPGGVALDKAAAFLADMSDVKGAYFDQTTNRIVFVGPKLAANQTPIFNKDDLAVAIRSVVFNNTLPAVNIGNPNDPTNPNQPVNYIGGIENTNMGSVMEQADYSLKKYGFGYLPNGQKTTSSVPGYKSATDRYLDLNPNLSSSSEVGMARIWISPQTVSLKSDTTSNSFVFDQVKMQVQSEIYPGSSPKFTQAYTEFAQHLNDGYDAFAQENEWFAKTKDLSKIVGVVKWLKDSNIVTDYTWARNYKPVIVATPTTVPFYSSPPISYQGGYLTTTGGVAYVTPNTYNQDNGTSAALKVTSENAAPSLLSDHWTYTSNSQTYQSVAVSANALRSVGGYSTGTTDLAVDTVGDGDLSFSRSYSSLASTSGEIGRGWDYMPARLTSPNKDVGVICAPQGGFSGVYQQKLVFQTQSGIYETFTYSCAYGQYLPDKMEYNTVITKELDGTFTALLKDQTKYKFDGGVFKDNFLVRQQVDKNGNVITYDYGGTSNITSIKDDQNRSLTINRNAQGIITSIADWTGRTVSYGYDAAGNLVTVTDPRGNAVHYEYDTKNRLTRATDRQNRTLLTNTYNDDNKITSTTGSSGSTANFSYDESNKVVTATDNNQRVTKTFYDDHTRIIKQVDPLNNYVQYTYGEHPVPLTVRDKNNNTTTYTYNDWADQLSVTTPDGKQVTKQYNNQHLVTNISDGRYGGSPKVTINTYDVKGNLLSSNKAGIITQYTYDAKGNLATQKDGLNQQTSYTYDTFGHKVTTTSQLGAVSTSTYDSLGRLTQSSDPDNKTSSYSYDNNNNVITATTASGTTTNVYDPDNQLTKVTTPDSKSTEFAYSVSGAQTSTKDKLTNLTGYGYDQYNNLVSRQDALNRTTQYAYDELNRKKQSTTPLGKVAKWEYDANGNISKRIDESNRATTYEYDNLNRLKKTTYPDASTITNTYDDRGNLVQVAGPGGASSYVYDIHDRLVSETDPNNATLSYTYDAAGNLTQTTYPDGKTAVNTFDAANRIQNITDWNGQQTTYQYTANGNLSTKLLPNGVLATYGYDSSNRLSSLQYTKNQTLVTRFNYERDVNGNITKETETKDAPVQLPAASYTVYGDSLTTGWNTTSSYNATINTADTPAYQGTSALGYTANSWGYVDIRLNSGTLSTAPYSTVSFAAKASQAGQKVNLVLKGTGSFTKLDISLYGGPLSATGYKVYNIPLTALGGVNVPLKGVQFSNEASGSQPKIYIDNLKLTTDTPNAAVMYDDAPTADFTSYAWSGAVADLNDTSSPYAGTKAIGLTLSGWGGLTLYDYRGINTTGYQSLSFAIKGSQANQNFAIQASNSSGTETGPELNLADYGGNPVAGSYKTYNIPVSSLVPTNGRIYGFIIKNKTGVAQPKILVDEIKLNLPDANGVQKLAMYTYDALGRVIAANYPEGKSYSYTYNAVGNRLTNNENGIAGTQTYNNDNQMTAKGSRTFTYDNQGNQITDGSKALTFDFDNKLKTWNSPSPSMALAYTYDGAGNRIGKAGGGATRQYANSTANGLSRVLVDKNTTNSTQTYYLYGDSLLSQGGAATSSRQYYLTDGMGNVRYVTDSAGSSLQAYTYDPYGNETTTSALSNYGFQGYEKDRENNLTYLHARYYDPTTGRFISKDPVEGILNVPQSQNGYGYTHGDPVNQSDPSGEVVETIWDIANVIYDISQCEWVDLGADTAAMFIPFVPAGSTKVVKAINAASDLPIGKLSPLSGAEIQKLQKAGIDPHDTAIKPGKSHQDIFMDTSGNLFVKLKGAADNTAQSLYTNINNL